MRNLKLRHALQAGGINTYTKHTSYCESSSLLNDEIELMSNNALKFTKVIAVWMKSSHFE